MSSFLEGKVRKSNKGNVMASIPDVGVNISVDDDAVSARLASALEDAGKSQIPGRLSLEGDTVVWAGLEDETPPRNLAEPDDDAPNAGRSRDFHNPYNFVPAPPRPDDGPLGDSAPPTHGRLLEDRWSGRLHVDVQVVTPVLVPDASRAQADPDTDHVTLPIRRGGASNPVRLGVTGIKGVLRSAYEAITNSRFESFEEDYVGYRLDTSAGLQMVPARVVDGGEGLELLTGTTPKVTSRDVDYSKAPFPAATLNQTFSSQNNLQHGQKVTARISLWQRKGRGNFLIWNVDAVADSKNDLPPDVEARPPHNNQRGYRSRNQVKVVEGYVYLTGDPQGAGIRKHDERFFFTENDPATIELTPELKRTWKRVITEYAEEAHDKGATRSGHKPPRGTSLDDGDLVYVRYVEGKPLSLHPVLVSRGVFPSTPAELIQDTGLTPAADLTQLSPADRLFGWVHGRGPGAYKGNVRIHSLNWEQCDVDEFGDEGLPLAILAAPKVQQARFYAGENQWGFAIDDGVDREESGYGNRGQGIRGRKVYPHHRDLPDGYWDDPLKDRTNSEGWAQAYRRPGNDGDARDGQNKSVQAWVRPGSTFRFAIDVQNLTDEELGALVWLLSLERMDEGPYCLKMGLGKPLGFGSVTMRVSSLAVSRGSDWKDAFEVAFSDRARRNPDEVESTVDQFKEAVEGVYGKPFEGVAFIRAFLQACSGFDDKIPINYPRPEPRRDPDGNNYKWFTGNERRNGAKLALPALVDTEGNPDPGLPYDP